MKEEFSTKSIGHSPLSTAERYVPENAPWINGDPLEFDDPFHADWPYW